jgi:prepilin-type N-terminal cleavage/methylation domain-containing protein/prepilin-type processing-associated H-X9-DG protein
LGDSAVARCNAFTLVELLVVVAIIGTLVALLLPAVQAARESARRTACTNHLHQIGIALHAFHNTKGTFPKGGAGAKAAELSWGSQLLPWIEEQPLADILHSDEPYTSTGNLDAGSTLVAAFQCPSVPEVQSLRASADLPSSSTHRYARTSYGGVQGERGLRAANATNNPERGTMIFTRAIAIKDITDGTSNTALVGEAPEGIHGIWIGVRNLFDQSAPINTTDNAGSFVDFGQELTSHHPGGANVLMVDSSVQFASESIDNLALAAMFSRAAGD